MEDFEETLERFKDMLLNLSEREVLSYWIWGEYEEARIYWGLAKKAEELRLPPSLLSAFRKLTKESEEHGDTLKRIYVKTYDEEPKKVDLPYVEAEVLEKAFEDPSNIPKVLAIAMETELVAMELYRYLTSITDNEEARKVYQYLADVEWAHYQRLKGEAELMGFKVERNGTEVMVET